MFFQSIYQMITAGTAAKHGAIGRERNTGRTGYGLPADHTPTDTEGTGTACQCGKFRETGRKGYITGQIIQNSIQQYRLNQRKPGKNGKRWKSSSRRLMMQLLQKGSPKQ